MKVVIEPRRSGNVLATTAMGGDYYNNWYTYAFPSWKIYCERHGLGLVAFDKDLLSTDDEYWKKANWQKLLIGEVLAKSLPNVRNVCFIDTDFLVNPYGESVFDSYNENFIGLVSKRNNLPYSGESANRRIAFNRNRYYDSSYPLDSSLFMSKDQVYEYHDLPPQPDEACSGFFVFNIANHSKVLGKIFRTYKKDVESITNGGDQTHFNYEIQSRKLVQWFDYRFQAIWIYEMAWKYPFLYDLKNNDMRVVRECIRASLLSNVFLHFGGSWYESEMWKQVNLFDDPIQTQMDKEFFEYINKPVTGSPVGMKRPRKNVGSKQIEV